MHGITTAPAGITFDQAATRAIEGLKGKGVGVSGDADDQGTMLAKPGMQVTADGTEHRARAARARRTNNAARVRAA
jgi:hypothetical protein